MKYLLWSLRSSESDLNRLLFHITDHNIVITAQRELTLIQAKRKLAHEMMNASSGEVLNDRSRSSLSSYLFTDDSSFYSLCACGDISNFMNWL